MKTVIIGLLFIISVAAFKPLPINSTYQEGVFKLESVSDKYELIKVNLGSVDIIFRRDAIEFFEIASDGTELQSTLFFENCLQSNATPEELLDEYYEEIENIGFAEVMGVDSMLVKEYRSIRYYDLFEGTDLQISYSNGILNFKFSSDEHPPSGYMLRSFLKNDIIQGGEYLKFRNHRDLRLTTSSNLTQFDDGVITFRPQEGRLDVDINFQIKTNS